MAHSFYAYTPAWTSYAQEHKETSIKSDRPRQRRRTLSHRVRVGAVTLTMTLCVMMALLMIALLRHANSVATKGYAIRQLAQERAGLLTENRVLKQQASELQSLATIQESPLFAALVSVQADEVTYVHHGDQNILSEAR